MQRGMETEDGGCDLCVGLHPGACAGRRCGIETACCRVERGCLLLKAQADLRVVDASE